MVGAGLTNYEQSSIERTHRARLPAYFLDEDESVIRIWPDGSAERIIVRDGHRTVRALATSSWIGKDLMFRKR